MKQLLTPGPVAAFLLLGLLAVFISLGAAQARSTPDEVPSSTVTDTHTTWVTGESGSPVPPGKRPQTTHP